MTTRMDELEQRKRKARRMGGAEKLAERAKRGLLSARERIDRLLDPDSFFELGLLNHSDVPGLEDKTAADGKICGYGTIDGRTVVVKADDQTVLAGSGGRVGGRKANAVAELAIKKGYPIINLGEAGGARIPDIQGSDGLSRMTMKPDLALRNRRVPLVAAILGECFGSPSWYAALADFVVQVKGSCMAVSGPRVLEVATGEKVTNEELGGWEVHARITGQVDRVAEDEDHCFAIIREFLAYLPSHSGALPPTRAGDADAASRQEALQQIIPDSPKRAYDMRELVRILVDHREIFELKPDFDRSVITALARLDGKPVGIIASNPMFSAGAMGPDGCDKCTSFTVLCDSFNIPLIFLHDTPGFFVGKSAELKRMPGKIINWFEALVQSTVPKISLVIRKSYGMAYSSMAGPDTGADFLFAWPTADISFMSPEVAANVTHFRKIKDAADPDALRQEIIEEMRLASAPWRAAGLHLIDDVVMPRDTRRILIESLALARGNRDGGLSERRLAGWPTTF
jgi:methylmalonyl-CoA decarboxylase subunit alpha